MNRPRKSKGPYPPCFYFKHGAFYVVRQNKWIPLGKDYAQALAEYAQIMGTKKAGGMPKALDDYFAKLPTKLAKSTREQYKHANTILKRKLQQFEPHEVKGKHVAQIKQSLAATPNMANRVLSYLRGCFADLVEQQAVESNPCVGIKRFEEEKRKRLLSDAEWNAIHSKAGTRLQVIMELQLLTGQRINDVLKIRRSQITDEGIVFEQQKTGAKLLVRWSPELRATVAKAEALTGERPKTLTLLRGRDGGAPDYRSVLLQWHQAREAAGVDDAKPNDIRAKAATTAKKQGKNATALLGHTSEAMTRRYLRDKETPEVEGPSIRQVLDVGQKS